VSERLPIGELDLLAFAADPLGLEPQRRAAVEAHLSAHPADADRVEAFRRQNQALRRRYDRYLHAPVPARLYDALEHRPARGRQVLRYAAAAAIIAVTAAAGWVAGDRYGGPALVTIEEHALHELPSGFADTQWAGESRAAEPVAVAGLLEYGAGLPELGHLGYSLVEVEPAGGPSSGVARLTYAGGDGRRFTLVLRSRWHDRNPGFQVEKRGDLSVVSWEEGRLAAELTSQVGREEALEIAEAVRASLKSLAPAGPLPVDGLLAAGAAEPADAIEGGPVLPQQIQ
jgi:anti-sigma factor RsiW